MTKDLSEAGTSVEVKPCPLCACPLEYVAPGSYRHPWDDDCVLAQFKIADEPKSIEAWNRRALIQPAPAETAGELYHLRNAVENLKDNLREVETRPTPAETDGVTDAMRQAADNARNAALREDVNDQIGALNAALNAAFALYRSPAPPPIGDGEGDLVARLRDIFEADHNRGCQGREYDCDCGYDAQKDAALLEAATAIEAIRAEVSRLTPLAVAYDYLESPARADMAEARISTAITALEDIVSPEQTLNMAWWQTAIRAVIAGLRGDQPLPAKPEHLPKGA